MKGRLRETPSSLREGENNNLANVGGLLSDVAMLCKGTISFLEEGWNLETVTDIRITVNYDMSPFTH